MKSKKMLKPGQPGTKRWLEKYGKDLFCVRYRYDAGSNKRITTVEIIVDERFVEAGKRQRPGNQIMSIRIGYEEGYLRRIVKMAGGRWNGQKKVWELPYREVVNLGLTKRIVTA